MHKSKRKYLVSLSIMLAITMFMAGCNSSVGKIFSSEYNEIINEEIDAAEIDTLNVSNINGSITVVIGDDETIMMEAVKNIKSISESAAKEYAKKVLINISTPDNELVVKTEIPGNTGRLFNASVNYTFKIPGFIELKTSTVNGSTKIGPGVGNVTTISTNGKIQIEDAARIIAETTNGAINIANCAGKLEANSTNGAIKISNCASSASVETVNGKITFSTEEPPTGPIDITTVNGGVEIFVPQTSDLSIDARQTNGSVKTNLQLIGMESGNKILKGILNNGTHELSVRTTNGTIEINEH